MVTLIVFVNSSGKHITIEPFACTEHCRGLQSKAIFVVKVGFLQYYSHAVCCLIRQLYRIIRLQTCKSHQRITPLYLSHQVDIVIRIRLQIRIAVYLCVCRRIIHTAHYRPITRKLGVRTKRQIE